MHEITQVIIALALGAGILVLFLAIGAGIILLASKNPGLFAEIVPQIVERLFRRG
jgi:hypothetical protein